MFYVFSEGDTIQKEKIEYPLKKGTTAIGMFHKDQWQEISQKYHIQAKPLQEMSKYACYECFDGFDFICVNAIDYQNLYGGQRELLFYMQKDFYIIFSDEPAKWKKIIENIIITLGEKNTNNRVFIDFFSKLIANDISVFDDLEKEIAELEQALITSQKKDCVKEIISLRKKLMILKKYHEQILDVLECLSENENHFFDSNTIKYFERLRKKAERFYQNILNMRDSVTQVRESYQAQVDISLNYTMKIFTVITTICLPLSLIVGWYGMNLEMPEYHWRHNYAMVIALSVFVVLTGIAFFKKKGWF